MDKRRPRRGLSNVYKYLQKGAKRCKEDGAWLIPSVPSDRTGGNERRVKHRRFSLNIKKDFSLWE